ncbi:MAG: type VI secretion system lipoprotein TssJ [Burkholderiaceae bacterium]
MLNRLLLLFALSGLLVVVQGCSTVNSAMGGNTQKEAKAEVSWDYGRGAIQIELVANADLNAYFNQAHTVVLGVFQLDDSKTFLKLINDPAALQKALATGDAGKDILHLERFIVNPDKRTILTLDRVQNAKYVGFAAGYYHFDAPSAARLFRIPLNIEKDGLVTTTYKAVPANLALRLYLGRQRIVNAQSLTFDPDKKPDVESIPLDVTDPEIKLTDNELKQAEESNGAAMKLRQ